MKKIHFFLVCGLVLSISTFFFSFNVMEYPLNSQEKSKEEQSTNISDFDECEELFNAMDQDGSGDISGEEWSSAGGDPDEFQTLDTDQSGSLDFSEWSIACID